MSDDENPTPTPSILAHDLHQLDEESALGLVATMLGRHEDWHPPTMSYRLRSDFQRDWQVEIGQYLATAQKHGYAERLVAHVKTQANRPGYAHHPAGGTESDKGHAEFHAEGFSAAMVAYYLLGTGWGFDAWEPKRTEGDTDLRLVSPAPAGRLTSLQIKTSIAQTDEGVRATLAKLLRQLTYDEPSIAFVCAPRTWSFGADIHRLTVPLYGSSVGDGHSVWLPPENRGLFFREEWSRVGAVATLHYVRGADTLLYSCVVLMNPNARPECRCDPEWFPHARVLLVECDRFRWLRGALRTSAFPDGTRILAPRVTMAREQ